MFDPKTGKAIEITLDFPEGLPPKAEFEPGTEEPKQGTGSERERDCTALKNALRYIPEKIP